MNACMLFLNASVWFKALDQFRPDILQATTDGWEQRSNDANPATPFARPGKADFTAILADPFNYAVMDRYPGSSFSIKMIPLGAGWSDLGAWDAMWSVLPEETHGNAHVSEALATDSRNTLMHTTARKVARVGAQSMVVETPDAVLVADRSRSQDISHIVNSLQQHKREDHTMHRKVPRPWGWYDSIDEGGRFKVKLEGHYGRS